MLAEQTITAIQEAMKDEEFVKSMMGLKTEEEVVNKLKDKGITVSVEDIKEVNEAVKKLTDEELAVSGGRLPEWLEDVGKGARNVFGCGENSGDFLKTIKGSKGAAQAVGAYSAATAAAAGVCALVYGGKKLYDKIKGRGRKSIIK